MVMDERRKIDLSSNRLQKGKKWYLVKISFYVAILVALLIYLWIKLDEPTKVENQSIEGIEIEM